MPTVPGEIRSLARQYSPEALRELARVMRHSESDSARVAAAGMLLDRAYGKAPQAITGENGEGDVRVIVRHIVRGEIVDERPMKTIGQVSGDLT